MNLKIGCCGFPPSKKEYFKKFKAVEVQQTFYRLPRHDTVRRWRITAPEEFEFTIKAWQGITHETRSPAYPSVKLRKNEYKNKNYGFFRSTDEVFKAWEETEKIADILKTKVIVFQGPPSFSACKRNKASMKKFFSAIDRKEYIFVWEPLNGWKEKDIVEICDDLNLVHCVDPFMDKKQHGKIRYFRLQGIGGHKYRYTGWDLKKLRDFCENESKVIKGEPIYTFFSNAFMRSNALRFEWIFNNTGRIKEIDTSFLQGLCSEIEAEEEDEKVQMLSREAERIVSLILYTDYARVDISIEKEKLREMCKKMFPKKEYLYEIIYGKRFDRLWEQFRETRE